MERAFPNRAEAGRQLAEKLESYTGRDNVIVLGLPRGGVPVAYEVAKRLRAPLDVFIVRKLGVPGFEELAAGAIASGGVRVLNQDVVRAIPYAEEAIEAVTARETAELQRREQIYREGRPAPELKDKIVILVDDGSSDESLAICREYAAIDSRIKVYSLTENKGPGSARQLGIERATGKYLTFIDSDDTFTKEALEK